MGLFKRRERSHDDLRAQAADEALRDTTDELRAEHQDAERAVKQAVDKLRSTERDREKRIAAANKQLAAASANNRIFGVGGILGRKAEIYEITVKVPEGEFMIDRSVRVQVHSEGRKTQKYDSRQLLLLIEGSNWASTLGLSPDSDTKLAHQFAQELSLRVKQIDAIHAQRAANIDSARAAVATQRAERGEVDAAHDEVRAVVQDRRMRLERPRTMVQINLDAVDADTKLARKAREALERCALSDAPDAAPDPPLSDAEIASAPDQDDAATPTSTDGSLATVTFASPTGTTQVSSDRVVDATDPDPDWTQVVGESFYQDNIERAVDLRTLAAGDEGVRADAVARLKAEPDNPHDPNAVSVWIGELQVGHLSRKDARAYQPILRSTDVTVTCEALVSGPGRADGGNLGVHLELARPRALAKLIAPVPATGAPLAATSGGPKNNEIIEQIGKLGELRDAGVLTDIEFQAKKAQLLERL